MSILAAEISSRLYHFFMALGEAWRWLKNGIIVQKQMKTVETFGERNKWFANDKKTGTESQK